MECLVCSSVSFKALCSERWLSRSGLPSGGDLFTALNIKGLIYIFCSPNPPDLEGLGIREMILYVAGAEASSGVFHSSAPLLLTHAPGFCLPNLECPVGRCTWSCHIRRFKSAPYSHCLNCCKMFKTSVYHLMNMVFLI